MALLSRARTRQTLAAGLTGAALSAGPARALDLDEPSFDAGLYVGWVFGGEGGGGFEMGLEARVNVRESNLCGAKGLFLGSATRVGLLDWSQLRLTAVSQGGAVLASATALGGELGLGYRFGAHAGLETVLGAELQAQIGVLRADFDPLRRQIGVDVGLRYPPFAESCYVIGRPLRLEQGFAPRPELHHGVERRPGPGVAAWCERARTEWASVPAFFELAEQLAQVDAPAALVERAYRAASDEIRHAVLSAGLASELGGGPILIAGTGHDARPPLAGEAALARLAVESWLDGCLGEGAAARAAAAESRLTQAPVAVRAVQRSIAADEAQHAELAWDVLCFTLERAPEVVRPALALARQTPQVEPEGEPARGLEAVGCLRAAEHRQVTRSVRVQAEERLHALLSLT